MSHRPTDNHRTPTDLNAPLHVPEGPPPRLNKLNRVFGALNSPLRLQLIVLLHEREHFVNEMAQRLDKSQPLISQHLRILKLAKLVEFRRQGRETVYRLKDSRVMEIMGMVAEIAGEPESGWISPSTPAAAGTGGDVLPEPDGEAAEPTPAMAPVDEEPDDEENTDEA